MKISAARLYRQIQPFIDLPYVCRGRSETGFDSSIVALEAEDGTVGWGEAAPLGAFYSEAFPEGIRAGIVRLLPTLIGRDATVPDRMAEAMNDTMFGQPAVKSAIDMAAWDLAARLTGASLTCLLGGREGSTVRLYRAVSHASPDAMAAKAAYFVDQGYRRLQVKVGAEPMEDIERIRAVRAAVPDDVPLYADANGAWSLEEAMRFIDAVPDLDCWIEQPCMAYADNLQIARHCAKPMIFDEGIVTLQDLLTAYRDGAVSGVSLKTGRIGGVGPTRLLRDLAAALGLKVTVEDIGGSTISTAATALMIVSMPERARGHTVDFMNWVTVANAEGMPQIRNGMLVAPEGSGLGVTVDADQFGAPVDEF